MSFDEAAAVCDGAVIALACLRKGGVREGTRILIYGASGSIGTAAVQLAKHFGADVTAVCNTKNVELVRSLGADRIVDYEREDFTHDGETYDVVFDAVGKHSFRRSRRSLKPGGIFVETDLGFMWHAPVLALATRWIGDKRVTIPIPKYTKENVLLVKELIEAGKYRRSHRPNVSARGRRRGDALRRDGTEDRQRRPDHEWSRPMNAEMLRQLTYDRRGEREREARMERLALETRRIRRRRPDRRADFSLLGYLVTVQRHATQ